MGYLELDGYQYDITKDIGHDDAIIWSGSIVVDGEAVNFHITDNPTSTLVGDDDRRIRQPYIQLTLGAQLLKFGPGIELEKGLLEVSVLKELQFKIKEALNGTSWLELITDSQDAHSLMTALLGMSVQQ